MKIKELKAITIEFNDKATLISKIPLILELRIKSNQNKN